MASAYNSRKFNLVPPKTKEEVIEIKERDNSFFYSFILIFCAIVVFAVLTLAQKLIVEPRIDQNSKNLTAIAQEISSYDNLKRVNGEIYIKSQALDAILLQDIKLTQLLETSEDLIQDIPGAQISTYSREASGQFVVDFIFPSINDVNTVFENSQSVDFLENLNLREVLTLANGGGVSVKFGFDITNIIDTDAN